MMILVLRYLVLLRNFKMVISTIQSPLVFATRPRRGEERGLSILKHLTILRDLGHHIDLSTDCPLLGLYFLMVQIIIIGRLG